MTIPTTSILSEKAVTDDPTEEQESEQVHGRSIPMNLETIRSSLHLRTAGEVLRREDFHIPLYSGRFCPSDRITERGS